METPNADALSQWLHRLGMAPRDIGRFYRSFNAAAEPFRTEADRHGT